MAGSMRNSRQLVNKQRNFNLTHGSKATLLFKYRSCPRDVGNIQIKLGGINYTLTNDDITCDNTTFLKTNLLENLRRNNINGTYVRTYKFLNFKGSDQWLWISISSASAIRGDARPDVIIKFGIGYFYESNVFAKFQGKYNGIIENIVIDDKLNVI